MYPTALEQISGIKRVLKDVVRPAVSTDFADNVLYFTVRLLNNLAVEIVAAHPANIRESARLAQLFDELLPELTNGVRNGSFDGALLNDIEELRNMRLADASDLEEAQNLVTRMRAVAAKIISVLAFGDSETSTRAIARYVRDLRDLRGTLFKVEK